MSKSTRLFLLIDILPIWVVVGICWYHTFWGNSQSLTGRDSLIFALLLTLLREVSITRKLEKLEKRINGK